jgi:hypothetical protein
VRHPAKDRGEERFLDESSAAGRTQENTADWRPNKKNGNAQKPISTSLKGAVKKQRGDNGQQG